MSAPNPDELRELLYYDPETGVLVWKKSGKTAGSVYDGRLHISVQNKIYRAHRVAWAIHYGEWPSNEIDHANNDSLDNRISNLRLATRSQNEANKPPRKKSFSGLKGVTKRKHGFDAKIGISGKTKYLGYFKTAEEAHQRYREEAKKVFGAFARF